MVLVITALASTGVVLALRDQDATLLDREAQRLIAHLEAGRAESRSVGQAMYWRINTNGFELRGQPNQPWLHVETRGQIVQPSGSSWLVLGPEPFIPAQSVELHYGGKRLTIGTDGFQPFAVHTPVDTDTTATPR